MQYCQIFISNILPTILGLDPTSMTLSQADVLSQIETAKQQGMTLEQENGIVKIAKDAQVGFCSSLV